MCRRCESDHCNRCGKHKSRKSHKCRKRRKSCNDCIIITRKDFSERGLCPNKDNIVIIEKSFHITKPGKYCLGESIKFAPESDTDIERAIIIDADNVKLDLCCNKLEQANTHPGFIGIWLEPGHKNIIVTNGTICKFQGANIASRILRPTATVFTDVEGVGPFDAETSRWSPTFNLVSGVGTLADPLNACSTLVNDLTGQIGVVDFGGCSSSTVVLNVEEAGAIATIMDILNTTGSPSQTKPSISITPADGAILIDAINAGPVNITITSEGQLTLDTLCFTDLIITDGGDGTFDSDPENSTGIDLASNLDDEPLFPSRAGYFNVLIKNCKINRNSRRGLFLEDVDGLIIRDTEVNNTFFSDVSTFAGLDIQECSNVHLLNVQVNNTRSTGRTNTSNQFTAGLLMFRSENILAQNCQFNNTFGDSSRFVVGARLSDNRDALYENCQFNNSTGDDGLASGSSFGVMQVLGVHIEGQGAQQYDGNGAKFINCQFNGSTRLGETQGRFSPGLVSGVEVFTQKNIVFERCQAVRNVTSNPFFDAGGFRVFSFPNNLDPPFGDTNNVTFTNCVTSDISAPLDALGFRTGAFRDNVNTAVSLNVVYESCIAEGISSPSETALVAGIGHVVLGSDGGGVFLSNLFVRNCRISDVKGGADDASAGILVESTQKPVLCNNSVSCCLNGILFTGSDVVTISTLGFQLATTLENAKKIPPVVVDLVDPLPGQNPVQLFENLTQGNIIHNNPTLSGRDTILLGPNIIRPYVKLSNNMSSVAIGSPVVEVNEPAHDRSTGDTVDILLVDGNVGGIDDSDIEGLRVITVLDANNWSLVADANATSVESNKGGNYDVIADLSDYNWACGDEILYDANGGGNIMNLVDGTTYFLVLIVPGFTKNGLVQENKVNNCSVSGYRDILDPTASAWVDNTAFNNGPTPDHDENYDINWAGVPPLTTGTLAAYPTGSEKAFNISLIP